ncbi:MAG: putative Na+/H+ antiporter [Akkermansia sp.]
MLSERNNQSGGFNLAVTLVFFGAIIHTFLAGRFERYSHKLALRYKEKLKETNFRVMHPEERLPVSFASAIFHFLGEVEAVFGIWLIPFMFVCWKYYSFEDSLNYDCLHGADVRMIIMIIASSRPICWRNP